MKFLIVIPARAGSTRIPNKNYAPLGGIPLISHTLKICELINEFDVRTVVSSNCPEIKKITELTKFDYIKRPDELCTATAKTEDALIHALNTYSNENFNYVVCLQPTSPFLKSTTLENFLEYTMKNQPETLMSYTESRGDYWLKNGEGTFERLFKDAPRRQQDRMPLYEENSAIYITSASYLIKNSMVFSSNNHGIEIDKIEAYDINTQEDLLIANAIYNSKTIK